MRSAPAGTLVIGTGGAVALLLTARRQRYTELALVHTDRDATERRITELYTKAADTTETLTASAPTPLTFNRSLADWISSTTRRVDLRTKGPPGARAVSLTVAGWRLRLAPSVTDRPTSHLLISGRHWSASNNDPGSASASSCRWKDGPTWHALRASKRS